MSDIAISVEHLSKRYLIGHQSQRRQGYTALRDVLGREMRNFARKTVDIVRGNQILQGDRIEEFWALKDLNFEIKRGEVIGVIGKNGAGKSTLLKILSRITEPTEGRVVLRGRIASLLEVGTGFHPELTGRENIFLNGAILGMSRAEIMKKFDEIVDFAEITQFLDTPVKRYSSGMYVRLAFAVAAHLEPEILIVDEVLAVGDADFQRKCLRKMEDESRSGRTVIFVSHNMGALENLCSSAIYLNKGRIVGAGPVHDQIQAYLNNHESFVEETEFPKEISGQISISSFQVTPNKVKSGEAVSFRVELASKVENVLDDIVLLFFNEQGLRVAIVDFRSPGRNYSVGPKRSLTFGADIKIPFVEGSYYLGLYLVCGDCGGDFKDIARLNVVGLAPHLQQSRHEVQWRGVVELEHSIVMGDAT
jgi:lipopolysaccharide transport system ATP-binding protein